MWRPKSLKNVLAKNKVLADLTNTSQGGVFVVQTDTVQGWGAWLDDEAGIRELMRLKSRELDDSKVFSLVTLGVDLAKYVELDDFAAKIVAKYGEQPLTLVLPKNPEFKHWYFDSRVEIGWRTPSTAAMQELAKRPFLLTSANERGGTPKSNGGTPTTVVRIKNDTVEVLRQGDCDIM
ncbi:MAG: Sua5/YciO/YrdC/YwlC family protein [Candidatus Nomurabacteria bacterium]|jgi:tRNA A37 threonylcarbamoyladenosine synthetase subunit TsaC/SUA5/YrdC|nr:Sua5/YciO/YrdC/YwlC family protein [Candidatus Nomurabacteria bacterium]